MLAREVIDMDIARIAMNNSQTELMSQVSTRILDISLETVSSTGAQMAQMLAEMPQSQPSGVMTSSHIDMLV